MGDRGRQILGFVLALIMVADLFVLILGVGFALHPPDTVGLSAEILPAAIVLAASAAGLILVIRSLRGAEPPPFRRLLPRRRGPRIMPTEAQLAYARDITRIATCAHLQPIEQAIRLQGIPVRLRYNNVVIADCHIDEGLLRQRYSIAPPLYYVPDMPGDRPGEPETALFSCREHSSVIEVVHRADRQSSVPTFPVFKPE